MSLENVGLHFVVGLAGTELSVNEKELFRELQPSGVILFKKNIANDSEWPEKLRSLISEVRNLSNYDSLVVSIDHEGGRVNRLPSPATHFPAAMDYRLDVCEVATAMALELRSLSINLSYAPLLDIDSEPNNPIIGDRSFSSVPEEVSTAATLFLASLEAVGVVGCGKHFPGHGDTLRDSHLELPTVNATADTIYDRELVPFLELINNDLRMIMTAHCMYPALDSKNPATLSRKILTDILRKELDFSGVIISDDLEMKALASLLPKERAIACLEAGVDLLLVGNVQGCAPLELSCEMAHGIKEAFSRGEFTHFDRDKSRLRIEDFQSYILQIQSNAPSVDSSVLGCVEHQDLLERIVSSKS